MDMKNTVILLIFLLAVLGLILGVFYTEDVSNFIDPEDTEVISIENGNETIIIHMEPKERRFGDFLT